MAGPGQELGHQTWVRVSWASEHSFWALLQGPRGLCLWRQGLQQQSIRGNEKTKINETHKISLPVPGLLLWFCFPSGCLGWKKQGIPLAQCGRSPCLKVRNLGGSMQQWLCAHPVTKALQWGPCEDFIPLSILPQNAVWQDLSLIFQVTS